MTGCAGFIGVNLAERLLTTTDCRLWGVDCLTYAANCELMQRQLAAYSNYEFINANVCSLDAISDALSRVNPDCIVHLAAESHVDTSIDGPAEFVQTNVVGTFQLLRASQALYSSMPEDDKSTFRFVHVSTDEVFGELGYDGPSFTENSRYAPNSPYSASKASADHFVRAWQRTYGLPTVVTNCSNNYGPHQHAEKLIPTVIRAALSGKKIPVYGDGRNIRDWIHVKDHADALIAVIEKGEPGQSYNIGGQCERSNFELVCQICDLLDDLRSKSEGSGVGTSESPSHRSQIEFVADRPGHDFRYAVDISKIRSELGWQPVREFGEGLRETVEWYANRQES